MVLFLELWGDCWVEGWPALVLLLKRQRKEWRRQICCLPSCAWGCLWTFENHPLGFMQSAQMFWFRHSGPSPLTFSHKFSSWVFPGPASLLSPHSPLSPHLIFSSCSAKLFLSAKLLSCYLLYYRFSWGTFLDLSGLATGFYPLPLLSLGAKREQENLTYRKEQCFLLVNLLIKLWVSNPWWLFFCFAWGSRAEFVCQLCYIKDKRQSLNRASATLHHSRVSLSILHPVCSLLLVINLAGRSC